MAEVLICLRNNVHVDLEVDAAKSWKPGYPVVVKSDGHKWGRLESIPDFFVLALPNVSVEDATAKYVGGDFVIAPGTMIEDIDPKTGKILLDKNGDPVMVQAKPLFLRRSRFVFDLATLAPEAIEQIKKTGRLVVKSNAAPTTKEVEKPVLEDVAFVDAQGVERVEKRDTGEKTIEVVALPEVKDAEVDFVVADHADLVKDQRVEGKIDHSKSSLYQALADERAAWDTKAFPEEDVVPVIDEPEVIEKKP